MPPPNIPQFGGVSPEGNPDPFNEPIDLPGTGDRGGPVTIDDLTGLPTTTGLPEDFRGLPPIPTGTVDIGTPQTVPPPGAPPSGGGGGIPSGGQGDRRDDSGQVPGVDLSMRDRINQMFRSMGLPPLPSNFTFTGGPSPQQRFLSGQDVDPLSGIETPTGYNPYGPGGMPGTRGIVSPSSPAGGGSFFGGTGLPIVPGSTVGPGNLGGGGAISLGGLPNSWSTGIGLNMAAGNYHGPLSRAQYKALMTAAMAANTAIHAGAGERLPGGGQMNRGAVGHQQSFQGGGVVQPSPSPDAGPLAGFLSGGGGDIYSRIGAVTYNAGRKAEDIFNGLGALGKFLSGPPDGQLPWGNRIPFPSARRFMLGPGSRSGQRDVFVPQEGVVPLPGYRDRTGPYPLQQEPPSTGRFLPQLYESSGGRLADTVPARLTPGEVVLNDEQQQAVMPIPGREHLLRLDQRRKLAEKMWA